MQNRQSGLSQEASAAKADISVRSGRRIENNECTTADGPRLWRTRTDPLAAVWDSELKPLLEREPTLTGLTLLEYLQDHHPGAYDCAVVDLRLPDMSGFELLDRIQEQPQLRDLPIVVFTGKELTAEESQRLRHAAKSVVVKDVESPERLLDETALFLHRVIDQLPVAKRRMVQRLHESDEALRDKRVLVVDDDVRNIFAMSSVLERHGMQVLTAGTGQEAIEKVAADGTIAVVLMDIMMPGMDGYDTMRAIREDPDSRALPIVALTAKAMKGDREKCLEAGASDYLAKPVLTDQLLGVLRQWLHR